MTQEERMLALSLDRMVKKCNDGINSKNLACKMKEAIGVYGSYERLYSQNYSKLSKSSRKDLAVDTDSYLNRAKTSSVRSKREEADRGLMVVRSKALMWLSMIGVDGEFKSR